MVTDYTRPCIDCGWSSAWGGTHAFAESPKHDYRPSTETIRICIGQSHVDGCPHARIVSGLTIWRGTCGHLWDRRDENTDVCPRCRLARALDDVAFWLDAEADNPRPNPSPAMRLQAATARMILASRRAG